MDLTAGLIAFPPFASRNFFIPSKDGGFVPLKANRIQREVHTRRLKSTKRHMYELKFRQGGLSTWHMAENLFLCLVHEGFGAAFITHTAKHATEMFRLARGIWDRIPESTKAVLPSLVSADEEVGMGWDNGSFLSVNTQGGKEQRRGSTVLRAHLSEFCFWDDPQRQLAALLPAIPPWSGVTIETTPNGFNHGHELWVQERDDPDALYDCVFLPWWLQDEYRRAAPSSFKPTAEERTLMQAHDLRPEQIMFRRGAQREHGALHLQEYPEDDVSCWVTTGDSVFTAEQIREVRLPARNPAHEELAGALKVWYDPVPGRAYVVGADAADGVPNGDFCAAAIRNARSGEHVATLMCNPVVPSTRTGRMDPAAFAKALNDVGRRYNNALIVVETNPSAAGLATFALLRDVHQYPNLYRHDPESFYQGHGSKDGMPSSPANKERMVSDYKGAIDAREFSTYDVRVSQQMADYIVWLRKNSGYEKVGARDGAKDDLMTAVLLSEHGRFRAMFGAGGERPTVLSLAQGSVIEDEFRL